MKVAVAIFTQNPNSFLIKSCYTYFVNNTTILFDLFIVDTENKNTFDCRNEFIANCEQDYICIVPEDYLLDINWLEDLLNAYKKDEKAGVLSIRNGAENCYLSPVQVTNDFESELILENVFKTPNNWVEGLLFFEKNRVKEHLDSCSKLLFKNHSDIALCLALSFKGYTNYYIRKQSAISLKNDEKQKRTDEQIKDFKKIVNQFVKENINDIDMADITKCTNEQCPMADSCKRATEKSSGVNQSFQKFEFELIESNYGSKTESYACEFFITNN
jgi:hypothetical protein